MYDPSQVEKKKPDFVPERLYIEDYYPTDKLEHKPEEEKEESDRGVVVIDIFGG